MAAEEPDPPGNYGPWIFPRDPKFAQKAGQGLNRSRGPWKEKRLGPADMFLSPNKKPPVQPKAPNNPAQP